MICLACGSEDVEDVRKAIMKESGIDHTAIKVAIRSPFKHRDRDYDMYECKDKDCGFLMFFRRKKDLQEITSEDVGSVSGILNPI